MRASLLHSLFPKVRAEVLRLLFTNPRQELYGREIARLSFLAVHTVQDELGKMSRAEVVVSRRSGKYRYYRANSKHPLYVTLRRLVIKGGALGKVAPPARRRARRKRGRNVDRSRDHASRYPRPRHNTFGMLRITP